MKILTILALAATSLFLPLQAGDTGTPLVTKAYNVPPSFLSAIRPGDVLTGEAPARIFDTREFFVASGVPLPATGKILYLEKPSKVVAMAPQECIDLIDWFFEGEDHYYIPRIRHELNVVSFTAPDDWPGDALPDFAELKKAAGSSWAKLGGICVDSRPGFDVQSRAVFGADFHRKETAPPESNMPGGVSGNICSFATTIEPDGQTMKSTISYRFRAQGGRGEMSFDGDVQITNRQAKVLKLTRVKDTSRIIALIYQATTFWPGEEPDLPSGPPATSAPTPPPP